MKRYITSSGNAFMAVSTMFGTGKNIQFGSLAFLEVQEINLRGNMRGSKCDEYCILYEYFMRTFSFYEKLSSPLDPVAFF